MASSIGLLGTAALLLSCGAPATDTDQEISDPVPASTDDTDGDGLSDSVELTIGTSPVSWDSDGDGCHDLLDSVYPECDSSTLQGFGQCGRSDVSFASAELPLEATLRIDWKQDEEPEEGAGGAYAPRAGSPWIFVGVLLGQRSSTTLYLPRPGDTKIAANKTEVAHATLRAVNDLTRMTVGEWPVYYVVTPLCERR